MLCDGLHHYTKGGGSGMKVATIDDSELVAPQLRRVVGGCNREPAIVSTEVQPTQPEARSNDVTMSLPTS